MDQPNLATGNVSPAKPRAPNWYLAGEGEGSTLRHIPLNSSPFTVGRLNGSSLWLASASVSKCHAELYREEENWFVRDLKSTNGTFLNDLRLKHPQRIGMGDVLHFANQEFRVGRTRLAS